MNLDIPNNSTKYLQYFDIGYAISLFSVYYSQIFTDEPSNIKDFSMVITDNFPVFNSDLLLI